MGLAFAVQVAPASAAITTTIRGTYIPSSSGTAGCNAGEIVVGGGAGTDNPADAYLGRSEPSPNNGSIALRRCPCVCVVASSQRGQTYTLRARAYIKVRRGRPLTKSISVRFQVCSS